MISVPVKHWRRRGVGAALLAIGFLLSPLSWWNDLFVNVPLALGFAWLVSWFYPQGFGVAFVVGYWLTNVLGLALLRHGGAAITRSGGPLAYTRRELIKDLLIALFYTGLIIILVQLRVLLPLPEYLPGR